MARIAAIRDSQLPLAARQHIDADDVPNILAFLSWMVPIDGAEPNDDERECVEAGRIVILEACRAALLREQARRQAEAKKHAEVANG